MASIRDVAKKAGVGVGTVSRALNGTGYVAEDTKAKILAMAAELDYQPNELARNLFRNRTGIIGIVVPDMENPFFSKLLKHMEIQLYKNGYKAMICNTIEISNREQDFIDMLRQNVMDGIITGAHSLQDYAYLNLNKPVVAMDRNLGPDIPIIHSDHKAGGRMAARLLLDAGCRNVQFDDCTWGMLADKNGQEMHAATKEGLLAVQNAYKDINNQVINGAPEGMNITTHVCRGNYHSTYASSGPYDSVADVLFGEENVSAYYLEFDDERSGGFAPLAKIGSGQKVVLGLITTKQPQLENKEAVIARIHEAAKYIPLDRLYLSPQCGFASCEIGNKLTEEEQWAKLALVKEIAEEVWG